MKKLICVLLSFVLTACAYTYDIPGSSESTPKGAVAKIKFSNTVKVSSIDSVPFSPKFSIWVGGSHQVSLPPGLHTFRFKYNAVSMNGGFYTNEDTVLSGNLEAGKNYEIGLKFSGRTVRFKIVEEGQTEW